MLLHETLHGVISPLWYILTRQQRPQPSQRFSHCSVDISARGVVSHHLSGCELGDIYLPHANDWSGFCRWFAAADAAVHVMHTVDHSTPYRVVVVEELCIAEADEELVASAVRIVGSCHAAHALGVRICVKLCFELRQRLLSPPALGHESLDDPMEYSAIVESLVGLIKDLCHVIRCESWETFYQDHAGWQVHPQYWVIHHHSPVELLIFHLDRSIDSRS